MPAPQRLDAVFFRSKSGNEPVRDWLKGLPKEQRQAIGEDIAYVQFKWPIGKPRVDHHGVYEIWASHLEAADLGEQLDLEKAHR